ncbi:hypothetical protein CAJAP_09765 [Camponotus japonicus]
MQETWSSNLEWDKPLTENLRRAWDMYVQDLQGINTIQVPRKVIQGSRAVRFNLHAFCDASLRAYGACIYLQTIDIDNNYSSSLLCSKSRVAPVKSKTITLPRLELCGAVVLVRLFQNVKRALRIEVSEMHAWSDSTIVLAWIAGDPSRQKSFVSNRVAEIQSILPREQWHHVDGSENPADLISRGTSLKNLKQSNVWWRGPDWLSYSDNCEHQILKSPSLTEDDEKVVQAEQVSSARTFATVGDSENFIEVLLNNFSSLTRIERILAWVIRFGFNVKLNHDKRKLSLCRPRRFGTRITY